VFEPIPDGEDLKLPHGFQQRLAAHLRSKIVEQMEEALTYGWERISNSLRYIREKCLDPDAKRFHQSMFDTLREACVMQGHFNMTDDPHVGQLLTTIKQMCDSVKAANCGGNPQYCQTVARQCTEFLAVMNDFAEYRDSVEEIDVTDVAEPDVLADVFPAPEGATSEPEEPEYLEEVEPEPEPEEPETKGDSPSLADLLDSL
jgi:hypothetical protein